MLQDTRLRGELHITSVFNRLSCNCVTYGTIWELVPGLFRYLTQPVKISESHISTIVSVAVLLLGNISAMYALLYAICAYMRLLMSLTIICALRIYAHTFWQYMLKNVQFTYFKNMRYMLRSYDLYKPISLPKQLHGTQRLPQWCHLTSIKTLME